MQAFSGRVRCTPGAHEGERLLSDEEEALLRALLAGTAAVLIALATWELLSEGLDDVGWALLAVGGLVCFGGYVGFTWRVYSRHERGRPTGSQTRGSGGRLALQDLRPIVNRLEGAVTEPQAGLLVKCLVQPRRLVSRITESVESASRSLSVTTTTTFQLPGAYANESVVVPVGRARRGELLDSVRVTDNNDHRLSTLDQASAISLIAASFRILLKRHSEELRDKYVATTEELVLKALASNEADNGELHRRVSRSLAALVTPSTSVDAWERLAILRFCLDLLRDVYPLLVRINTAETASLGQVEFRISLHRRFIPDLLLGAANPLRRGLESVRYMAGVTPSAIAVDLSEAARARSYHLQIRGPEGTYLARQRLISIKAASVDLAESMSRYSMRMRRGQRYGHLYMRGVEFVEGANPHYVAYFYERPPGSIAAPTVSAFASVILIGVAGFLALGFGTSEGSDVIAVLLSVPAIAGAWAGADRDTRIAGPRLGVRLLPVLTILVAMSATILYVLRPSSVAAATPFLARPNAKWWVVDFVLAVSVFVTGFASWLLASRLYSHFAVRDGQPNADGGNGGRQ